MNIPSTSTLRWSDEDKEIINKIADDYRHADSVTACIRVALAFYEDNYEAIVKIGVDEFDARLAVLEQALKELGLDEQV